jgi:Concanavalin A-like lectin/glucanases superfamily
MKQLLTLLNILLASNLFGQSKPVAQWNFDAIEKNEVIKPLERRNIPSPEIDRSFFVKEEISANKSKVLGSFHKSVNGVVGNSLQLDGNTSYIETDFNTKLSGDFSVGAWLALGAYPTHWCPVADQNINSKKGFFLGIDAYGHAGINAYIGGKLVEVQSEEKIPLRQWAHIQGVFSPAEGLTLYVNGKSVGNAKTTNDFESATSEKLLIGKSSIKQKPEGTVRQNGTQPVYMFFDGLIDELKIYDDALTANEVIAYYNKTKPKAAPALATRSLPLSGAKPAKFGAVYTTLKFYEAWDKPWPVSDQADIVINFDDNAHKFVFWRGTSYIPHWVTENGIWYNNEFLETWDVNGCHEPMSDKRCQFSNVKILESNDARVVVHWRYALIDNLNIMARVDSLSGFGEWGDEIYTIYPDGVGVRKIILHSSQPQSQHEWQEGMVVMGPGQRPEQVLEAGGLTLANMKGETHTYDWGKGLPTEKDKYGYVQLPEKANIHLINTKSQLKPFVIISPKANAIFNVYNGELRSDVSMYPWWNHWPAAQKPSDGRYAMTDDNASHSSLTNINWDAYELTENTHTKIMLHGLTNKKAEDLRNLTNSWATPAKLNIAKTASFSGGEYDPTERAYQIKATSNSKILNFSIEANKDAPLDNTAIVVKNWGNREVSLKIDGKNIPRGKMFRYGFRDTESGSDLVIYIEKKSVQPVKFSISTLK